MYAHVLRINRYFCRNIPRTNLGSGLESNGASLRLVKPRENTTMNKVKIKKVFSSLFTREIVTLHFKLYNTTIIKYSFLLQGRDSSQNGDL